MNESISTSVLITPFFQKLIWLLSHWKNMSSLENCHTTKRLKRIVNPYSSIDIKDWIYKYLQDQNLQCVSMSTLITSTTAWSHLTFWFWSLTVKCKKERIYSQELCKTKPHKNHTPAPSYCYNILFPGNNTATTHSFNVSKCWVRSPWHLALKDKSLSCLSSDATAWHL